MHLAEVTEKNKGRRKTVTWEGRSIFMCRNSFCFCMVQQIRSTFVGLFAESQRPESVSVFRVKIFLGHGQDFYLQRTVNVSMKHLIHGLIYFYQYKVDKTCILIIQQNNKKRKFSLFSLYVCVSVKCALGWNATAESFTVLATGSISGL